MRAILTLLGFLAILPAPAVAEKVSADLVVYRVEEAGLEPYFSRILVTADHLRMDEGDDAGGYTLYDRFSGMIYNVDPQDQSVLVIDPPRSRPPAPVVIELTGETLPAEDLPAIDGTAPRHHRLMANGEVCEELVAVPGVMARATIALADFYDRLAGQHGTVVSSIPGDLVDPCDLAEHVYAPRRPFSRGLPVERRSDRVRSVLVDHAEGVESDASLFTVPDSYRRLAMPTPGPAAAD